MTNERPAVLGLAEGELRLAPWTPEWAMQFVSEDARLREALGNMALDIQHVGSTSVPLLAAKPILDISIAVESFEEAAASIEPLAGLGYEHRGEFGIPRRRYYTKGAPRTHQIHMFEISSEDWRRHILFRDYLRENESARLEYEALKYKLMATVRTREEYQAGKHDLIKELEGRALDALAKRTITSQ